MSLFEFKSVDDVGAGKLREMLTLHTNPHAVHGSFTPKDDCERQVWNDPTRFSGGAETRYKKYPCKAPCKRKSYETICENIVSRYKTLVSSLPGGPFFCTDDRKPIYNCAALKGAAQ